MNRLLPFADLALRHPGISEGIGRYYEEAARVCLDRDHSPPIEITLSDNLKESCVHADWLSVDEHLAAAWANDIDATEAGACALALATLEHSRGMYAIRRAETLTGADYYVDLPGTECDDLESAIRLEISGTADKKSSVLDARLAQKLKQTAAGASNLPAMAIVVGFAQARILSADLQ